MKKFAVPAAVLAGLVMTAPVALAQDTGPGSQACFDARTALDAVPEPVGVPSDLEQKDREAKEALDAAQAELDEKRAQDPDDDDHFPAFEKRLREAQSANEEAAAALAADQERFAAEQQAVTDAEAARDEACAAPEPTDPAPSPEPEPSPPADLDCVDFPLADGTSAQDELARDDTDPHRLDSDDDGVACELDDVDSEDTADVLELDSHAEDVVVPSGGIDTGGGPA